MSFSAAQVAALEAEGVARAVINRAARRLITPPKPSTRQIGPRAIALMKHFEGVRLAAYKCPAGIWTIGWGNTFYEDGSRVKPGDMITRERADELFRLVVARFEDAVHAEAPTATAGQFGAMVSLAYNIGIAAFRRSSVLRHHRAGDHARAADAFLMWNKAGGRVLPGLVRRRQAERMLYLNDLPAFDRAIGYKA